MIMRNRKRIIRLFLASCILIGIGYLSDLFCSSLINISSIKKVYAESTQYQDGMFVRIGDWGCRILSTKDKTLEIVCMTDGAKFLFALGNGICIIPAEIDGYKVKGIGSYLDGDIRYSLFYDNVHVVGVVIPEGIEYINGYAFANSSIETVLLPSTLKSIGEGAFGMCSNLKSVTLPDGLEIIGENTFRESGLEKITVPESVENIGTSAFQDCTSLEEVNMTRGVRKIGVDCFNGCSALKRLQLSDDLETIDERAFIYCTSLESVEIPSTVNYFGFATFWYTPVIKNWRKDAENGLVIRNNIIIDGIYCRGDLIIPEGIVGIAPRAFYAPLEIDSGTNYIYASITSIKFPDTLKYIGVGAFMNCYKLESVIFSDNLENVEKIVFKGCKVLEYLELNGNLKFIEDDAIIDREELVIKLPENMVDYSVVPFSSLEQVTYKVKKNGTAEQYLKEHGVKNVLTYEGEDDMSLEEEVSKSETSEEEVSKSETSEEEVGKSETSEEEESKLETSEEEESRPETSEKEKDKPNISEQGTPNLDTPPNNQNVQQPSVNQNVEIDSVGEQLIGEQFVQKKNIYLVTGYTTVTFLGCSSKNVKTLTVPTTVIYKNRLYMVNIVAKRACKGYKKLKTVIIGNCVSVIEAEAFMNCTALEKVVIGSGLTEVKKKAFYCTKKIKKFVLRTFKLKKVEKKAFIRDKSGKRIRIKWRNGIPKKLERKFEKMIRKSAK